jgi:DNA-binding response OmpR family regulator
MLFSKPKRVVKRILIVEDEPLTAFDNETMLGEAGYTIVGTIDAYDKAMEMLDTGKIDLILSDVRLASQQTGIDLARAAKARGVPTLFATGHPYPDAGTVAVGCLMKPYSDRQLKAAIESVDRHLQGESVKPPKGLQLFTPDGGEPTARH